jgi:hypothetical protein
MRLEINFRSSTILGLVGAGGIGQELMTNIKLDRYDQVSITLLLIILVVRRWICCPAVCASGYWRVENESLAGRTRCGRQPSAA